MVNLRRLGVVAVSAALVSTACGGNSTSTSSNQPLKIGVTAPLSGNYAAPGVDIVNASKVMADTLNKSGGINGRKVQIGRAHV